VTKLCQAAVTALFFFALFASSLRSSRLKQSFLNRKEREADAKDAKKEGRSIFM
jgi:hypothetical protein